MVGARPIRRHTPRCFVWARPRAYDHRSLRSPRLAMPCHGVTLRSTHCVPDLPQSRTFGLDRLVETEERRRSHVGHSHVCDLRPRRCQQPQRANPAGSCSHRRRPSSIDRYRDDEPPSIAWQMSLDEAFRLRSFMETLNSQTMRRSNCVSAGYASRSDSRNNLRARRIAENGHARFRFSVEGHRRFYVEAGLPTGAGLD